MASSAGEGCVPTCGDDSLVDFPPAVCLASRRGRRGTDLDGKRRGHHQAAPREARPDTRGACRGSRCASHLAGACRARKARHDHRSRCSLVLGARPLAGGRDSCGRGASTSVARRPGPSPRKTGTRWARSSSGCLTRYARRAVNKVETARSEARGWRPASPGATPSARTVCSRRGLGLA